MYRLRIYGDHDLICEIPAEYETLEEAQEAESGIWVEILNEEEYE